MVQHICICLLHPSVIEVLACQLLGHSVNAFQKLPSFLLQGLLWNLSSGGPTFRNWCIICMMHLNFPLPTVSYPKICPLASQDISYIYTQGFLKGLSDKPSPIQSTQIRVWQFSDQDRFSTPPMVIMPPHMLQRISTTRFKPHRSTFLRQLLRWLKISCIGQKVNCGQHTVKTSDFWSTSSF